MEYKRTLTPALYNAIKQIQKRLEEELGNSADKSTPSTEELRNKTQKQLSEIAELLTTSAIETPTEQNECVLPGNAVILAKGDGQRFKAGYLINGKPIGQLAVNLRLHVQLPDGRFEKARPFFSGDADAGSRLESKKVGDGITLSDGNFWVIQKILLPSEIEGITVNQGEKETAHA